MQGDWSSCWFVCGRIGGVALLIYEPQLLLLPMGILVGGRELNSISVVGTGDDDADDDGDSNDCAADGTCGSGSDGADNEGDEWGFIALPMSYIRFGDAHK